MKKMFEKIICVIGIVGLLISPYLCLFSTIVLFGYAIYNRVKTQNKKLNICIWLYIIQLAAYFGNSLNELNYANSTYELGELIGFNFLGIIATYILFKNKRNDEQ